MMIDVWMIVRNIIVFMLVFVVKMRDVSGMKVFVNVCVSYDVVVFVVGNDEWCWGLMFKCVIVAFEYKKYFVRDGDDDVLVFFLCEGWVCVDVDFNVNLCMVFDVVFNDVVLCYVEVYKLLKRFIVELSLRRCREMYGIVFDIEYRLLV